MIKLSNSIDIENDGYNIIKMVRDHYKGVHIFNIRLIKTLTPNYKNELEEITKEWTVYTQFCDVNSKNFKSEVANAISVARQKMVEYQKLDQIIEGTFKDYVR